MIIPDFYKNYVASFKDEDCVLILKDEYKIALKFYKNINNNDSLFRYQNDKWSIKEILGHICDAEQIFAFRLLSMIRDEQKSLPGFEHNDYVAAANFNDQNWEYLIARFDLIRKNTLLLLQEISELDYNKSINANGNDISLDALVLVIAGHEKHHRKIIEERYLSKN